LFKKLADGGRVVYAMEKTFWSERFGMVIDRFGIPWMINCEARRHLGVWIRAASKGNHITEATSCQRCSGERRACCELRSVSSEL
jgi:hypothetical protein